MAAIDICNISVSFGEKDILKNINWSVPEAKISTILGPNGCGKSTLLKVVTNNLKPLAGTVLLGGKTLSEYSHLALAQQMAFLPQAPELPKDMLVEELVYCGRFPYQKWWKSSAKEDRIAVEEALRLTKTLDMKERLVVSLSGGERQRVWIAMALAQQPKILLLDEPTTYLDINHQLETLELLKQLNREQGLTVVMVLHEMNQAMQYSDELAVIHRGILVAHGSPHKVMTGELLEEVFSVAASIECDEEGSIYTRIKGLVREKQKSEHMSLK